MRVGAPLCLERDMTAPSIWRHVFMAAASVIGIALGVAALAKIGPADRAFPSGMVELPPRDPLPLSDTLMAEGSGGNLPDLLAGSVAIGENPTEAIADSSTRASSTMPIAALALPDALPPAPIAELHTASTFGPIPMRSPSGRTVFRAYARPFDDSSKPNAAVVVGGLGVDAELTERAIVELPPNVTLSFAAHASGLQDQIDLARAYGHEVVLELPMEGRGTNPAEPGADRRLRPGDTALNLRNLDYLLSRGSGYFAVMPYNGDVFLARADASAPVLAKLDDAGLGFLSDPQLDVPTLEGAAAAIGLPYKSGAMLVDQVPERTDIDQDLERLRTAALAGNSPIGFAFAYPATLEALRDWTAALKNVELAPASSSF